MSPVQPVRPAALTVADLRIAYEEHVVVTGASFTAPAGAVTALIGPNGAGKSTLLKGIGGLVEAEGSVRHGEADLLRLRIRDRARHLSLVPQATTMSIAFTAREVVALGRHPLRRRFTRETEADQEAIEQALAAVGAADLAEQPVTELSGGQRQLVHIGRALAQQSPVLLFDEPTSALDLQHQVAIYSLLRERAEAGATVIVVLHDLGDVARWCDRAALLHRGRIRAAGPVEEVLDAALLSEVYATPITVDRSPVTGALVVTPWPAGEGAAVR
ncbi:MAG: ABC transporter ATP-binding protein [Brachybacterium sp.]